MIHRHIHYGIETNNYLSSPDESMTWSGSLLMGDEELHIREEKRRFKIEALETNLG